MTGRRANQLRYRALCSYVVRDPNGIRTRATAVKGRGPRPLDDGAFQRFPFWGPAEHTGRGLPAPKSPMSWARPAQLAPQAQSASAATNSRDMRISTSPMRMGARPGRITMVRTRVGMKTSRFHGERAAVPRPAT